MTPELQAWMDDATAQIDVLIDSGLLGKPRHRAEWLGLALLGRDLGLSVPASLRAFYVKDGAPVAFADTLLALMRAQSGARIDIVESTNQACCIEAQRGDAPAYRVRYLLHDGMERDLPGAIASNYTAGWIRGRVISVVARVVFPDVCTRIIADEDLQGSDRYFTIWAGLVKPTGNAVLIDRPKSRAELRERLLAVVPDGWDAADVEAMIDAGEGSTDSLPGQETSAPGGARSEGSADRKTAGREIGNDPAAFSPVPSAPTAPEVPLTPHQKQVVARTEPILKPEQAILVMLRDEYGKAEHPADVDAIAQRHQESIGKLGAAAKRMAYADFQAACDRTKRAEIARRQQEGG